MSLPKITEADFQRQVLQLAKLCGWLVAHFRSVRVQRANGSTYWQTPVQGQGEGFPDCVLLRKGRQVVCELKVGRNKTTEEQEQWLEAFRLAGAEVYLFRPEDWSDIEKVLA